MNTWNELNFRTNLIQLLLAIYEKWSKIEKEKSHSFEHCVITYSPSYGLKVSTPKGEMSVTDYRYNAVHIGSSIKNLGDIPYYWLESLAEGD